LPRCEPLELTVPPEVPPEVHSSPQIVIAHRGASSHLPEHSLEGYRLALELGADYIEPDLVATADHHLVAMHSLDLTVTTNVEEVFGASKPKTLSRYKQDKLGGSGGKEAADADDVAEADATGYWVYDFTLEELKQLRLKQRLGGSENNGRSKAFDGLFQIPTLTEILELLNDWNEKIQPLWYHDGNNNDNNNNNNNNNNTYPHRYPPPPRGLYAELKDFPWLLKDANINLIDLFFDHISKEKSVWEKGLLRHMCNTKRLKEHEYKLAPLVMQSFEAEVLKNFTNRWEELANNNINNNNKSKSNSTKSTPQLTFEVPLDFGNGDETAYIPLPTPPTILLVGHDACQDENFWFEMEDLYRKTITGIGPDKMCFFQEIAAESEQSQPVYRYKPTFMEKAKTAGWKVHPWTERPEEAFFATTTENDEERRRRRRRNEARQHQGILPFENVLEELLFLKCTVGVDGVFSESVDIAVRAMGMACPGDTKHSHGSSSSSSFDTNEIPLGPVIGFSFVSGILAALMVWKYSGGGGNARSNNNRQQQRRAPHILGRRRSNLPPHSAVPTEAADDDDNSDDSDDSDDGAPMVLDDTDREIL
jgi:glycerophosphoryl diester phosphodiesterase